MSSTTVSRAAHSDTVERLARLGYLARGAVYVLIGLIALQVALGDSGGRDADQRGAFAELASKPFGTALLWVLALGLAGYALWCAINAAVGHRDEQDGKKRALQRGISVVKAVIYTAFAVTAARTATGGGGKGNDALSARVMSETGGRWLVGLIGVVVVVTGLAMVARGVKNDFSEQLEVGRIPAGARRPVLLLGKVGTIARGVVFVLAGWFVVQAAVTFDPDKAKGFDVALRSLARAPFGTVMLVLVALGLVAFGAYSCVESRYRRLSPTSG